MAPSLRFGSIWGFPTQLGSCYSLGMTTNELPTEIDNDEPLAPGTLVQYRKVGTFRVVRFLDGDARRSHGAGWYLLEPVKAPKKYREAGPQNHYVSRRDALAAK